MDWFRMYDEIIDDPKTLCLKPEVRWYYCAILCVSNRQSRRGTLPKLRDIACHLRLSEPKTMAILEAIAEAGLLDKSKDDQWFTVHGWEKRQRKSDNVAERVAAWRENHPVTLQKRDKPVTSRARSETETETETEEENPPSPFRSAEDQSQFNAAIELLKGSMQTEGVAMELSRRSDLSEIRSIEGWRWLNAARVMGKGAKAYTIEWLIGIARNTTRTEFEAYGKQPSGGKFARKETGAKAPDSSDRPWEDPKYLANAEKSRKELADIKARKEANGHL